MTLHELNRILEDAPKIDIVHGRWLVQLYHSRGNSVSEIAEITGLPKSFVEIICELRKQP